ncbi:hypothetical protein [Thioalkalivibrio sp. ALgr3]|uniref:hypothetical protein n=1 Tax=Thioalkalivibrio sp. ALgr3 TaxID=1239292 RepID=UPI001E54027C|nr:hypothetical protein [Thioalkalivibrio sp. ALgr3]
MNAITEKRDPELDGFYWDANDAGDLERDAGSDLPADDALVGWNWSGGASDFPSDEALAELLGEPDIHAEREGDHPDSVAMGRLGNQDADRLTQGVLPEPVDASLQTVPHASRRAPKGREKGGSRLTFHIRPEDWDDPVQRDLVRLLQLRMREIIDQRPRGREFLAWMFSCDPQEELSFDQCARALGAEPNNIRLRLQSYLYRHWIYLNRPLSGFFVAHPPRDLMGRCLFSAGPIGEFMALRVWLQPGIPISILMRAAATEFPDKSEFDFKAAVEALLESRLMLENAGSNLYLVGHYGYRLEREDPWR